MATVKKVSKTSTQFPVAIAVILVVVGVLGLLYAVSQNQEQKENSTNGQLQVIESGSGYQSQKNGDAIQGAAKTTDLMQGRSGSDVQQGGSVNQGTSVDDLLENKEIK